nr:DNA repair protein RAD51 homolog 2-like [Saimiri boliviensis boliviensis]
MGNSAISGLQSPAKRAPRPVAFVRRTAARGHGQSSCVGQISPTGAKTAALAGTVVLATPLPGYLLGSARQLRGLPDQWLLSGEPQQQGVVTAAVRAESAPRGPKQPHRLGLRHWRPLCLDPAYGIKAQRSADFSPAFLSTTLSALDEALHGGGASGSLTEITGPPGCGKTQFCIMMSILATLSTNMEGLKGAVVYIDTESAFSAERLVEIAESRFLSDFNTEEKLLLTSCKVHLYRELTCDEVLQKIESLEEEIISKGIKLVTIDSLASVVNKEFDTQLPGNLNKFLAREASSLKYLAEEFSIPAFSAVRSPVAGIEAQKPSI